MNMGMLYSGYGKNTRQQHRLRYLIQTTPSQFITSVLNRYSECVLQSLENHVRIYRKRGIFYTAFNLTNA